MADSSELITIVRKSSREEYRFTRETYQGRTFAQVRVWYGVDGGEMKPGRAGISVKPDRLDEVIAALQVTRNKLTGGDPL